MPRSTTGGGRLDSADASRAAIFGDSMLDSRRAGQGQVHGARSSVLLHLRADCQGAVEAHCRGVKVEVVLEKSQRT
jgi:hypothetical protein